MLAGISEIVATTPPQEQKKQDIESKDADSLAVQENLISMNVLKVVDVKEWNRLSFTAKQLEFKDTCFAILRIVNNKLYRPISNSLELYFKKRFGVSRAQVYRLYESAAILKILENQEVLPFKERLCRQLKNCVGLDQEEIIRLWNLVVKVNGSTESKLASFNIEAYFTKTLERETLKKPAPSSQPKRARQSARKGSNDNSDTDYSDTEGCGYARTKRTRSRPAPASDASNNGANAYSDVNHSDSASISTVIAAADSQQHKRKLCLDDQRDKEFARKGTIDERLLYATGIERDYLQFQQSIHNLFDMGYSLETMINGEWVRPCLYKLNTILDLDDMQDLISAVNTPPSAPAPMLDFPNSLSLPCKAAAESTIADRNQSGPDLSNFNTLILAAESALR